MQTLSLKTPSFMMVSRRSPGLYHMPRAAERANLGMSYVDSDDAGVLKPEGKMSHA